MKTTLLALAILLPISAVLPSMVRIKAISSHTEKFALRLNSVLHKPGFKKLMTTPVSDGSRREANSRRAYSSNNLVVGYLQG